MSNGYDRDASRHDGSGIDYDQSAGAAPREGRVLADGGTDPEAWSPDGDAPTYGGVKEVKARHYIDAVRAGFDTHGKAGEAMGDHRTTAQRQMAPLAQRSDAPIEQRGKEGNAAKYVYDPDILEGETDTATEATQSDAGSSDGTGPDMTDRFPKDIDEYPAMMPDARHEIDFDAAVPEGVPEYHPSGDEYTDLQMYADVLEQTEEGAFQGKEPLAVQLVGPTGTGKTHAPERLAQERGFGYYEITLKDSIDPADLEGYPNVLSDLTTWTDGSIVEAILSTHVRPTVIVLDEVNRAPKQVRSVFMSLLDKRAAVQLEARGGEEVAANKSNLLVVSTRNPNDGDYEVYQMDPAEKDRLGKPHHINYLGMDAPEKEAGLLADRENVREEWATLLVEAANEVREAAQTDPTDDDPTNTGGGIAGGNNGGNGGNGTDTGYNMEAMVDDPVATRTLLAMARDAALNAAKGRPSPSVKAVRGYLENTYEGDTLDVVLTVFKDKVEGEDPVDPGTSLVDVMTGGDA